jgi:protein TonB
VSRAPVRLGGDIRPPTLLQRVDPVYPDIAVRARVEGVVILEAIIDEEGRVKEVKVVRSVPLLDRAAIEAVERWRCEPVVFNGRTIPVILNVVVSFRIPNESTI